MVSYNVQHPIGHTRSYRHYNHHREPVLLPSHRLHLASQPKRSTTYRFIPSPTHRNYSSVLAMCSHNKIRFRTSTERIHPPGTPVCHIYFLASPSVVLLGCTCLCCACNDPPSGLPCGGGLLDPPDPVPVWLINADANKPVCRDRGFSGDNTGLVAPWPAPSPDVFPLIPGLNPPPSRDAPSTLTAPPLPLLSDESSPPNATDESEPSARRRAFSWRSWTDRKCERSSCHLISSRPAVLDREEICPPKDPFGAICKNPAELTALRRFRSDTNAELCGSSIKRPYRHLNR